MALAYSATNPQDVVAATEDTAPAQARARCKYALQLEKKLTKDADPRALPEHRAVRQRRVRHLRRQPGLLRQEAQGPHARRGRAARRPGQGADGVRPDHRDRLPAGARTAATTSSTTWSRLGAITPAAGRRGQGGQARRSRASARRNGCVAAAEEQLGLLLRLLLPLVDETRRRSAPTQYERERRLKSGGYRIITSLDVKAQDAAKKSGRRKQLKTGSTERAAAGRRRARHRPGPALAVNRNFKLTTRSTRRTRSPPNPAKSKQRHQGHLPEHHQPAAHRRRRHHRLPGRLDVQDVHHGRGAGEGLPARLHDQRRSRRTKSKYIVERGSPAACPGTNYYCPQNAGGSMAGVAQHVDRLRHSVNTYFVPLRSGSAPRTWSTWPSGSASSSAPASDADDRQQQGRRQPVGRLHPRRLRHRPRSTWRTRTPRWPPTASTASRPRCRRSATTTGKKLDVANPRCKQAVDADVARAAVDAARCPVGDQSRLGRCAGATAGDVRGDRRHPVSGKTGTTDDEKTASLVVDDQAARDRRHPGRPGLAADQRTKHASTTTSTRRSTRRCGTR